MDKNTLNWPVIISKARSREELTKPEIEWSMNQAMSGEATEAQIAGLLTALVPEHLTSKELSQFGIEMTSHATKIRQFTDSVDIVGTGGDQLNTVNISTMASLVVAASGLSIVKHGNRASSSSTGSADVIEALGVNLSQPVEQVERTIDEIGIGFLFAQLFHPSMKFIAPVRKQLGVPTVFNYLGPLTNPAGPNNSVIGVAHEEMVHIVAKAFQERPNAHTLVVRGDNGLDEISICGSTTVVRVSHDSYDTFEITPEDFGLQRADISEIRGGYAQENAQVVLDFLNGKKGAVRDAVLMNAAAGLYVGKYFDEDFKSGFKKSLAEVTELVDSGKALSKLNQWKAFSAN